MRTRINRTGRAAVCVSLAVLAVPSVAVANHVFDDVADGRFYAEPVEWAAENAITTGVTPTEFAPEDPVTRGESVTFLKRYEDNIVAPRASATDDRVTDVEADIDELRDDRSAVAVDRDEDNVNDWEGEPLTQGMTLSIPSDGYVLLTYDATFAKDSSSSSSLAAGVRADINIEGVSHAVSSTRIDQSLNTAATYRTISVTHLEPVEAGFLNVTGVLEGTLTPAGTELQVFDQTLTALFVPQRLSLQPVVISE